jgi:hypothetical protein
MHVWDKVKATHVCLTDRPEFLLTLASINPRVVELGRSGHVTLTWLIDDLVEPSMTQDAKFAAGYRMLLAKYMVWILMFPSKKLEQDIKDHCVDLVDRLQHYYPNAETDLRWYMRVDFPLIDQPSTFMDAKHVSVTMHYASLPQEGEQ